MIEHAGERHGRWFDRIAAGLGIACAIHCLSIPLIIGVLPLLGLTWLASETAESWIISILILTAIFGAYWGLKRHGNLRILSVFILGVVLLAAGNLLHEVESLGHVFTLLGSVAIAGAHLFNMQSRKRVAGIEDEPCCDH